MNYNQLIETILEVCIIPLLGVLTTFLVSYLKSKNEELKEHVSNDLAKKYMDLFTETVTKCVIATNQTYVESLKEQGVFDTVAQEKALKATCDNILLLLGEEATTYLKNIVGDLDQFIRISVEAEVNKNKK